MSESYVTPKATMNILLLEDERELAESAKAQMELRGHTVTVASNIEEAHRILDEPGTKVDILIADHQVPDGSGAHFAIGVKGRKDNIRVVVVSGRLSIHNIEELEAHDIAYFDKPMPYAEIVEEIIKKHF
jgi:DNA-binding NtrC family response regulator